MPLARCWLCGFWLDCKLHLLADIGRRLDHGVDEVRKLPAVHGAKLEPSPLRVRDESGIGKGRVESLTQGRNPIRRHARLYRNFKPPFFLA